MIRNEIHQRRRDGGIDYFPMVRPLSGDREPLRRRCVGLSTVIIADVSHNRSGRWDNIVSGGAAGERLNRARLGIRVPGCSIAGGALGGPRPHHLPGWIPPAGEELLDISVKLLPARGVALTFSCYYLHREVSHFDPRVPRKTKDWNFWYFWTNSVLWGFKLMLVTALTESVYSICGPKSPRGNKKNPSLDM